MTGQRATLAKLIPFLESQLDHPLLDQTSLTGEYDFRLDFATARAAVNNEDDPAPSIFSALQEQMGPLPN